MSISDKQQSEDDPKEALQKAIQDANEILVTATTIGPLHKISVTLTLTKLFIEEHSGLGNVSVRHLPSEDLVNIDGSVGPVGGIVKITTKSSAPNTPLSFGPFHREDTLQLKRIIQGYIAARQRKINLRSIPIDELKPMLYELGVDDSSVH